MKRIISFGLWGKDTRYLDGAISNILLAEDIYPNWICRFYCRDDVPFDYISKIKNLGSEIIIINSPYKGDWEGLFWRFYPAAEQGIDRFISRDTDSLLNVREKAAVDEWISSGKPFHIMRDHPAHGVPILGGMFGCIGGLLINIRELIDNHWSSFDKIGVDQDFLTHRIWATIKNNHIAHDENFGFSEGCARPFPPHDPLPSNVPFVGARTGID